MSVSETTSKAPQLTSKEATKNKRTSEAENERNIVRKTTVAVADVVAQSGEEGRRSPGSTFGARSLANAAAEKQTSKRSERTM